MTAAPGWRTALLCRCPACGTAPLFSGLLRVRDICPHCGLDLRAHDAGDGPAVLVIFVLGVVIFGLAAWLEFRFAPPIWLHFAIWPALTVALAVALMRPLKAALIAVQYHQRKSEMGL